jgi:hypothetical protein
VAQLTAGECLKDKRSVSKYEESLLPFSSTGVFCTAIISRLVSKMGLISTAFPSVQRARVGGSWLASGIRTLSTRIGITRVLRFSPSRYQAGRLFACMALTVNVTNSLFNPGCESVDDDHMQPKLSNFFEVSVNLKLSNLFEVSVKEVQPP